MARANENATDVHRTVRVGADHQASPKAEQDLLHPYVPIQLNASYIAIRAIADRILALILLLLSAPVMLVIAAAVVIDSGWPILFRQERVGLEEQPFAIWKFRSMATSAPHYSEKVSVEDVRITRVGRFIRATCLDELPQLVNVVRGDMAIIGPRPEQIPFLVAYTIEERQRHRVRPGVTGWWQVHHRDGQPLRYDIAKDLYYIQHQGLLLDLRILMMTTAIVLKALTSIGAREAAGADPRGVEVLKSADR